MRTPYGKITRRARLDFGIPPIVLQLLNLDPRQRHLLLPKKTTQTPNAHYLSVCYGPM
jgi:hypothetical protein